MNLIVVLLAAGLGIAEASPPNWTGNYSPCDRHPELLNREHLDLGVRISTSNATLARQFAQAMEFWTSVLDLEWHEVDSQDCSIQLVDGTQELFAGAGGCGCIAARAQFPDSPAFEGWIAFNPSVSLTERDMYSVAVHEIGHLFGLPHNPSGSSVMFFLELDESVSLDAADLGTLALRHRLRAHIFDRSGRTSVRVAESSSPPAGRSPGWIRGVSWLIRHPSPGSAHSGH
jgi:hypothetical protein